MPTQVMQGGGSGFFDAASKALESGAERGTDFYVKQQQLKQNQEALKLEEKKFTLSQEAEAFRQRRIEDEAKAKRNALKAALPEFQSRGLLSNLTPEMLDEMDPDAVTSTMQSVVQMEAMQAGTENTRAQTNALKLTAPLDARIKGLQAALMEIDIENAPEELRLKQGQLAVAQGELAALMRQVSLQERTGMAELATAMGVSVPHAYRAHFGDALGDPAQLAQQDLAAYETEAEEGESLEEFISGRRLQRAFGFFGVQGPQQTQFENLVKERGPNVAAQDILLDESLSNEEKALGYSLLKAAYGDEITILNQPGAGVFGFEVRQGLFNLGQQLAKLRGWTWNPSGSQGFTGTSVPGVPGVPQLVGPDSPAWMQGNQPFPGPGIGGIGPQPNPTISNSGRGVPAVSGNGFSVNQSQIAGEISTIMEAIGEAARATATPRSPN